MRVDIYLPRAFEAAVQYDGKQEKVTVRPAFPDGAPRPLLFVAVSGEGGRERLYQVRVSGGSGRLTLVEERKAAPCKFDALAAGQGGEGDDGGSGS